MDGTSAYIFTISMYCILFCCLGGLCCLPLAQNEKLGSTFSFSPQNYFLESFLSKILVLSTTGLQGNVGRNLHLYIKFYFLLYSFFESWRSVTYTVEWKLCHKLCLLLEYFYLLDCFLYRFWVLFTTGNQEQLRQNLCMCLDLLFLLILLKPCFCLYSYT